MSNKLRSAANALKAYYEADSNIRPRVVRVVVYTPEKECKDVLAQKTAQESRRSQCPPRPTLRHILFRRVGTAVFTGVLKLAYDAWILNDRDCKEIRGDDVWNPFHFTRWELKADEEKCNFLSAWKNHLQRTFRKLFFAKPVEPSGKRETPSEDLKKMCTHSIGHKGLRKITFFNPNPE